MDATNPTANNGIFLENTGIHQLLASDPQINVLPKVDVVGPPAISAEIYCTNNIGTGVFTTVHIPNSLVYSAKRGNGIWCFYDSTAGTVIELYEWQRCSTGSQSACHFSPRGPYPLTGDGRFLPGGGCQFGSRMCAAGGVVRAGELVSVDPIPHALKIIINTGGGVNYGGKTSVVIGTDGQNWRHKPDAANSSTGVLGHVSATATRPITGGSYATYWELGSVTGTIPVVWEANHRYVYWPASFGNTFVWPSLAAQSGNGTNSNLMMGSLVALPPSFDINTLTTLPAQKMAQALITYGAYPVDTGGTTIPYWGWAIEVHGNFGSGAGAITNSPVQYEVFNTFNIDMAYTNQDKLRTLGAPTNTTQETIDFKADMDAVYAALRVVVNTSSSQPKGPGGAVDVTPPAQVTGLRKTV